MVEILIAAVIGGLVGAFGTAAWLRRKRPRNRARERRSGGAAAALQRSILDSLQDVRRLEAQRNELNSKAFLMKIAVIRIRMAKVIENESDTSRSQAGNGMRRTTRIASMPTARANSPFLR